MGIFGATGQKLPEKCKDDSIVFSAITILLFMQIIINGAQPWQTTLSRNQAWSQDRIAVSPAYQ
jgi:hypothetical protein